MFEEAEKILIQIKAIVIDNIVINYLQTQKNEMKRKENILIETFPFSFIPHPYYIPHHPYTKNGNPLQTQKHQMNERFIFGW